jgi:subtilisin family serine protease
MLKMRKFFYSGFLALALAAGASSPIMAQSSFENWHMLDMQTDGKPGISAIKAYNEILKGKTATPVIVAIIDSGTESFHEDLKANIWVNKKEIAGNGIDDDNNGYIDDVHGWSFIGGKGGDVSWDNLEITRIYRDYKMRYGNVTDEASLSKEDKAGYKRYLEIKQEFERRKQEADAQRMQYSMIMLFYKKAKDDIAKAMGKEDYTLEELEQYEPADDYMKTAKEIMMADKEENVMDQLKEVEDHFLGQADYQLNLSFDPRSMIGDNYNDVNERHYGNNHIDGPEADHGTHVAGIVGAVRNNGVGMDGVAENVQLMIIRCVPNGDERDKDVANAIRYAVDNGARVINMSFGKSFSPQKDAVDAAAQYAAEKNVLLVHAAGNDSKNIDKEPNFPTDKYVNGKKCSTWLEIGASDQYINSLPASFSNYGKKNVDVFSPGVDIYATLPDQKYGNNSGTSMAAPVTAGLAAVVMSYYPQLTAQDVKAIILKSSVKYKKTKVTMPGDPDKKVKFKTLSATGGVVNLYEALKLAEKWKPGSAK